MNHLAPAILLILYEGVAHGFLTAIRPLDHDRIRCPGDGPFPVCLNPAEIDLGGLFYSRRERMVPGFVIRRLRLVKSR